MSVLSIAPYFPFRRIKITDQTVTSDVTGTHIQAEPDKRFQPICHGCGQCDVNYHPRCFMHNYDIEPENIPTTTSYP